MPNIDWSNAAPGSRTEELLRRTNGARINYFPGENNDVTQEEVADQILKAMDQIASGDAELVLDIDEYQPPA